MDDLNRSLNNQLSRINLGLSLLNLEQGLCNFMSVCNLHEFHRDDFDANDLTFLLDDLTHARCNESAILHE